MRNRGVGEWPFLGRADELSRLRAALDRGRGGIVLSGDSGVGKSRLAREVLAEAAGRGHVTESVVATVAASAIPFGAVAHLLPDDEHASLSDLDVLRHAGRALAGRAAGRVLVLGVDDAHLLDPASAALIHHLVTSGTAFVVCTLRSSEAAPDPLVGLWSDPLVARITVGGLGRADVEAVIGAVLDGDVEGGTLHRIWTVSGGNALFLRELLTAGLESGGLRTEAGLWRWAGGFAPSPALVELVEARLAGLAHRDREALEVVAAAGSVEAAVIEAVVGSDELVTLERRGLVEAGHDGARLTVRVSHPLYAEVVQAATPLLRARAIWQRLAEALETTGMRRRDDNVRLASWRLTAGAPVRADVLLAAASRLMALHDHSQVERLARAAIDAGGGAAAARLLGTELYQQGRHREADAVLATVTDVVEGVDGGDEWAGAVSSRVEVLFWGLGQASQAIDLISRAEKVVGAGEWREELAALRATILYFLGRPQLARQHCERLLRTSPGERPLLRTLAILALIEADRGATGSAIELADRGTPIAAQWAHERPHAATLLLGTRFLALVRAGRLDEADAMADAIYQLALTQEVSELQAMWAFAKGEVALARGRPVSAARWLREARLSLAGSMMDVLIPWCDAHLARACALAGDERAADAALTAAESAISPAFAILALTVDAERPWVAAARGEVSVARELAQRAALRARELDLPGLEAASLHDAARLGAGGVASRLEELAPALDGPAYAAAIAHTVALAKSDGGALDAVSQEFEAIGADLLAAEAAAQAAGLHRAEGLPARAAASARRATELTARCEGAATPGLRIPTGPDPLTAREREVATLAARGLSNGQIAARLSLSSRTVASHLYNAYGKLGVSERSELPGELAQPQ